MKDRFASIFPCCGAVLRVVLLLTAVQLGYGQEAAQVKTNAETESIEKIVREYLLRNPEVIRDALQEMQARDARAKAELAAKRLSELRSEIYSDSGSPEAGNPRGDIAVVVFFDYNCGYCKSTLPQLQAFSTNDANVRVIFKEFPVLGPHSWLAAKAALAADRQGKYVEFHNALMTAETTDEDSIKNISKIIGIDHSKLQKDMADPQIDEQINRNHRLASSLEINGTPAYIIGDQIIPGAIDADSLTRIVTSIRKQSMDAIAAKSGVGNQ